MTRDELQAILAEFAKLRVLVVGNVCLDRWCSCEPELACPSRETGIPRTAVVSYHVTPGGGGTVANNLAALGVAEVEIVGVVGNDGSGIELDRAFRQCGINSHHLVRDPGRQTFTYSKLINTNTGVEDLPRLDFVNTGPPSYEAQTLMVKALHQVMPKVDAVLVADQSEIPAGAVVTSRVRETVLGAARLFPEKTFVVDSRAQVEKYHGLIVKPNEDEVIAAAQRILRAAASASATAPQTAEAVPPPDANSFTVESAGNLLRRHLGGRQPLYVTRGAEGALLFGGPNSAEGPQLIPARRNDKPVDICGAGDAFEAGLALALAATARLHGESDFVAAAQVGHLVAAVTITKPGTGTASPAEVLALFDDAATA